MKLSPACSLVMSLALAAAPAAFAGPITYATINPGTTTGTIGTIGSVSFSYTGAYAFINASNTSAYNYFTPLSTYTSAIASNAPTDGALIAVSDSGLSHTFLFSTPVTGLIFSEVSLGQGGVPTSYTFDSPFTVLSCGPGNPYGGGCFASGGVGTTGNVLQGNEADGTIEFAGPINELTFTTANGEYWNGFDIGLAAQNPSATPEPGSLVLLGTGLLGVAGAVRRRFTR